MLPLYEDFTEEISIKFAGLLKSSDASAHPGLLFDKFPHGWSPLWHAKLPEDAKKKFFNEFTGIDYGYLKDGLQSHQERQENLVRQLCGTDKPPILYMKTDWRFVSGLGSGHPYETGFIWHRTLGVPYLPGSSVKGMIRAWSEQWCDEDECNTDAARRLFGSKSIKDTPNNDKAGTLIVFDALPVRPPTLELDILNPHYQPYYDSNGDKPPADYYNPVPVFFLTVAPDQPFRFCLAPRPGAGTEDSDADVQEGIQLLQQALETLGAGGKTAVGYGTFKKDPEERKKAEQRHLRIKEQNMPKEERWRLELSRKKPQDLVNSLSRNWSKTKTNYGDDLEKFIEMIREIHGEAILRQWKNAESKNKIKAFKKIYPGG